MFDTLYLDPTSWDLVLDANGGIAMANAPYAAAQDVASSCRLWTGEYIYDITRGIPYEKYILGYMPPRNIFISWLTNESITVPDVSTATPVLAYNNGTRDIYGQIQVTLTDGTTANVNI